MKILSSDNNPTISSRPLYIDIDKQFLMGIAITLVWLYHLRCTCNHFADPLFLAGFIGVDIFLFLSAYGLCYSYNKNPLRRFYMNRVQRVYPLFFMLAFIYTIIRVIKGQEVSVWDWFCNLSSLSYYKIGGSYVSWYLSLQLLFYLLFPLLYKWSMKLSYLLLILSLVSSMSLLAAYHWHWRYDSAISRIPIFLLGILFFMKKDRIDKRKALLFGLFTFLIGLGG